MRLDTKGRLRARDEERVVRSKLARTDVGPHLCPLERDCAC